jgi:hypothetical protein
VVIHLARAFLAVWDNCLSRHTVTCQGLQVSGSRTAFTQNYIDVAEQRCSFPALKIPNWLNDADSQAG